MRSSFQRRLRCIAALLAFAASGAGAVHADYTAVIQPSLRYGTWDGWGCSLAWWANVFGSRTDLAQTVFSTRTVRLDTATGTYLLPGLGLNIVRYNIGGSGGGMNVPPTMPAWKQVQGYWAAPDNRAPHSGGFYWDNDRSQRRALLNARGAGANLFEAFSTSPMWWMCADDSAAGSKTDGAENLAPENYGLFADYLATVVKHARDRWRVRFGYVSPFNEPSAGWWNFQGAHQEGCNIGPGAQQAVIRLLRTALDRRGLRDVGIAASDENSPDRALRTWTAFDGGTQRRVAKVNTHGYSGLRAYRGPSRPPLYAAAASAGKTLWVSESGDADGSGLTMAQSILLDFSQLHPTGWVYWQPFDSGGWGLIQSNPGDRWIGAPNVKYYVLAQFSRSIRQGMTILSSGDPRTAAAYDPAAHTLALVTLNNSPGQWISYDLSRFRSAAGPITRWNTQTGGGDLYARHNDTFLSGGKFRAWFSADSIQTFVVRNVSLPTATKNSPASTSTPSG